MIAGDPADWDDFFQQNLIPAVLSLVIGTWDRMEKPEQTAHENDISFKLTFRANENRFLRIK